MSARHHELQCNPIAVSPGPEHRQNALVFSLRTEKCLMIEDFTKVFGQPYKFIGDRLIFGFNRWSQQILDSLVPLRPIPAVEYELRILTTAIKMVFMLMGVQVSKFGYEIVQFHDYSYRYGLCGKALYDRRALTAGRSILLVKPCWSCGCMTNHFKSININNRFESKHVVVIKENLIG